VNLPRSNIIRQPNDLRALLDERRFSQNGDVFSHAVFDPGEQKGQPLRRCGQELSKDLRAVDFSEAHCLDLIFLRGCDLEQRFANDLVGEVRHAAVCLCFSTILSVWSGR
jgi:hypothetical protein